jgi:hypothetical protein
MAASFDKAVGERSHRLRPVLIRTADEGLGGPKRMATETLSFYEQNGVWRPQIDGQMIGDSRGFATRAEAVRFYSKWFAARIADGDLKIEGE